MKIEVINMENDGWFREHMKEQVISTFDIRLPDVGKYPFDKNGNIILQIDDVMDIKKLGLKPVAEMELKVKRKQ